MSCYLVLAAVATAVLSYPTGTYQTHHIVRYQNYQYPNNITFNVSDYSQYLGDCIAPGFSYSPILPSSGPPNCDSAPNHSGGKGDEIVLSVQDIGDGAWNVS